MSEVKSHTIHYGNIVFNNEIVDEVLVMVMAAPNTYTKEDTIEINCHGGSFVMKKPKRFTKPNSEIWVTSCSSLQCFAG